MDLTSLLDLMPSLQNISRFRRLGELNDEIHKLATLHPDLVAIQRLGESRGGSPINMVSIGNGPKSALLVGAPHPNEPIGCLTIEHLLRTLCASEILREALPFRWHFVPAIEPDAIALNESWFDRPEDLHTYLRGFFRPALCDQAEYGFPFEGTVEHQVSPMAENEAYKLAIQYARPDLFYPLHNMDFGGAFYYVSYDAGHIVSELKDLTLRRDLHLNRDGEGLLGSPPFGPGVFVPFDVAAVVREEQNRHGGVSPWAGGDSSCAYAGRRGAFSLIAEMPLWDWSGARSPAGRFSQSGLLSSRDEIDQLILSLGVSVITAASSSNLNGHPLIANATKEIVENAKLRQSESRACGESDSEADCDDSIRNYIGQRINGLRQLSLIGRLSEGLQPSHPVSQVAHALAGRVVLEADRLLRDFDIVPVPLAATVATQTDAAIIAAACIADARR